MPHSMARLAFLGLIIAGLDTNPVLATPAVSVPFTAGHWTAHGNATFLTREAFPGGLLQVTSDSEEGYVTLTDGVFSSGTIDVDIKPVNDQMPGVRFRQGPDGTAEMVYIRASPDCPASQDCLQYVPLLHGRILWDMYPQFQASAPVVPDVWNHLRLVVAGRRLAVFVNHQSEPSLTARLQGEGRSGTLALEGKAVYANLTITPALPKGIVWRTPDAPHQAGSMVTRWAVTPPAPLGHAGEPTADDQPTVGWAALRVDEGGLVNLARRFPPTARGALRQYAWLRTTLVAAHAQTRQVALGFLREVAVFVNGKEVFAGKNLYNVPGSRLPPDGRLSLDNAGFDIELKKGLNNVVVAIDANTPDMRGRYGWGLEMKLDKAEGIRGL